MPKPRPIVDGKGKPCRRRRSTTAPAFGTPGGSERPFPWGTMRPQAQHGNFNFHGVDPDSRPFPSGRWKALLVIHDLMGNGWEWTSTVFAPFEGFEPFPFYPGYSADFFDGNHYVMKGGSPRTSALLLRRSFRNWFQPRYPTYLCEFPLHPELNQKSYRKCQRQNCFKAVRSSPSEIQSPMSSSLKTYVVGFRNVVRKSCTPNISTTKSEAHCSMPSRCCRNTD